MEESVRPQPDTAWEPVIAKVSDLPLAVVLNGDDSVLSTTLRRLVEEIDQTGESYAAHSSSS